MTVIAAYKDKTHYWMASDSCGFAGILKADHGSKLIKKKNYIIGFAGFYRVADIIKEEKSLPKTIDSLEDLKDFRDLLKQTLIEEAGCPSNATNEDILTHPVSLLLATQIGIYELQGTYQLLRYNDNYGAIGAGEDFAMGSLATCRLYKEEDGKVAVTNAVKSAIKHCTEVGGRIYSSSILIRRK